jgi:uncharacterized protein (TIGR02145 family)
LTRTVGAAILSNTGLGVTFDGYTYSSIILGNGQEWMAENLRTSVYANGDPIPNQTNSNQWPNLSTGAWVYYDNNSQFENPYGKLYNWYAVADPRNVCPVGWHVASDSEWNTLIGFLDNCYNPNENGIQSMTAGGKLKSVGTQFWSPPNTAATNEIGFSGLPAGFRDFLTGEFFTIGNSCVWWSSSESYSAAGWLRAIHHNSGNVHRGMWEKQVGLSVRCLRDATLPQGSINNIDCGSAVVNGELFSGISANITSITIPYTGGNGGAHNGQLVSSSGVSGLIASIDAAFLANGNGFLTYNIAGTPSSSGIASFAINIGGQTCTLIQTVNDGYINNINCGSANNNGTLIQGTNANNVNSSIPYTGGNGGTHNGQTISSTGVTGLTATLAPGSFDVETGNIIYIITGTPSSSGTASFALNIGGQTCILNRTVYPVGNITALSCTNINNTGTPIQGIAANNVNSSIPYTGGNGGIYEGQTVISSGVTGLTASISSGIFANGSGSLIYTISGTPISPGTASFTLNIGGQTCTLTITVAAGVYTSAPGVGVTFDGYNYSSILLGNGQEWMAENLRTSIYANGDDIYNETDNNQWISLTIGAWAHYNNDNQFENPYGKLYNLYAVNDARNVCPTSWHVPSAYEWTDFINYIGGAAVAGGRMKTTGTQDWQSPNMGATNESGFSGLPGGARYNINGAFIILNGAGFWWSSTEFSSTNQWVLTLSAYNSNANLNAADPTTNMGLSVRCIKD